MQSQILIYPKSIKRRGIKARQEHVYDKQNIDFTILYALAHILVVILKLIGRRIVLCAELGVIVGNGTLQKIS